MKEDSKRKEYIRIWIFSAKSKLEYLMRKLSSQLFIVNFLSGNFISK